MTTPKTDRSFWLAWGLILLVAFIVGVIAWAVANARITVFTLQPKSAPAAKPTTFHDTARQPEKKPLAVLCTPAPRFARVVDCFSQPSRGSFRSLLHDNQLAGSRVVTGARFYVCPGASNTAAVTRPTLPAS